MCSGIEVVITGLTRNQFGRKSTRVRIPPAAWQGKSLFLAVSLFVWPGPDTRPHIVFRYYCDFMKIRIKYTKMGEVFPFSGGERPDHAKDLREERPQK